MRKSKIEPFIVGTVICIAMIIGIVIGHKTSSYLPARNTVPNSVKEHQPIGKLNINEANADDFLILDGIGPVTAQRIVDYREENGPFLEIEDIKNVEGIGEVTFSKIEEYITTGG